MQKVLNKSKLNKQLKSYLKQEKNFHNKLDYMNQIIKEKKFKDYISSMLLQDEIIKLGVIFNTVELRVSKKKVEIDISIYDSNLEEYFKYVYPEYSYNFKDARLLKNQRDLIRQEEFKDTMLRIKEYLVYFEKLFILEGVRYFKKDIRVNFYGIAGNNVNAQFLARFIGIKLQQGYGLNEILNETQRGLNNYKFLSGYRIDCAGRFSRKQRADYKSKIEGRVPLSSIGEQIDSGMEEVILKYGKCSVRVWLNFTEINIVKNNYKYKL